MSIDMGLKVARLSATEREALAAKLLPQLHTTYPRTRVSTLKAIANKDTFSSLELVMGVAPKGATFEVIKAQLLRAFCTGESASTDTRLYFQHGNNQVEVQFVEPENFDMTVDYLAYQELGRLVSKFVHARGLSLSGRDLHYRYRFNGDIMGADLRLANSWSHALEILGMDHTRWTKGFADFDEVFEFVASSPLFLKSCFAVKDSEPGSRRALRFVFAEWLEHQVLPAPVENPLQWLFEKVPGFETRYHAVVADDQKRHGQPAAA